MNILTLMIAGLLAWYVWVSLRTKEQARYEGRVACERQQLLFLDESVVLIHTRLRRNTRGRIVFKRCYTFEFTSDGAVRHHGTICLLGKQVESIEMEPHRLPIDEHDEY